jgi:hypothetical protein
MGVVTGRGWDGMDLREREDVDEAVWDMYIPCQPVAEAPTAALLLCAPNLRRRADTFRPLDKRARQQFAVAVAGYVSARRLWTV